MELFLKAGKLKRIDREGWKHVDIDNPESVADHPFKAAFIALILGEKLDLDSFS